MIENRYLLVSFEKIWRQTFTSTFQLKKNKQTNVWKLLLSHYLPVLAESIVLVNWNFTSGLDEALLVLGVVIKEKPANGFGSSLFVAAETK